LAIDTTSRRRGAVAGDLDQPRGTILVRDDLHAVFLQVGVEVRHLLLRELDLLEGGRDLLEGQVATLLSLGDEPAHFLDVE
jgi:hypothetical protein